MVLKERERRGRKGEREIERKTETKREKQRDGRDKDTVN